MERWTGRWEALNLTAHTREVNTRRASRLGGALDDQTDVTLMQSEKQHPYPQTGGLDPSGVCAQEMTEASMTGHSLTLPTPPKLNCQFVKVAPTLSTAKLSRMVSEVISTPTASAESILHRAPVAARSQ